MGVGVQGINQWQVWREVTGVDTSLLTAGLAHQSTFWDSATKTLKSPYGSRCANVHPKTGIMLQAWIVGTNPVTVPIQIWGLMDESKQSGPGPATLIYDGNVTDKNDAWTPGTDVPLENNNLTAGAYDGGVFSAPTTDPDFLVDLGGTRLISTTTGNADLFAAATLGYSNLLLQVNAAPTNLTRAVFLWRGVTKEGAI